MPGDHLLSADEIVELVGERRCGTPPAAAEQRAMRIAALFEASVGAKAAGHGINDLAFLQPARPMSAIGG